MVNNRQFGEEDVSHLVENGFASLRGAFDADVVQSMRAQVLAQHHLMANTRANPTARHVPGIERFAEFAPLHDSLKTNAMLQDALGQLFGVGNFDTIGLSDITINRSQNWHTDLLRGPYASHLTPEICWGTGQIGCLKALLYLQDGRSLKVLPGSHRRPVSLADDSAAIPKEADQVMSVDVAQGDLVLMDIRLMHRGSSDADMRGTSLDDASKILISTVFGARTHPLSQAMKAGNAHRMQDWDAKHFANRRSCPSMQQP